MVWKNNIFTATVSTIHIKSNQFHLTPFAVANGAAQRMRLWTDSMRFVRVQWATTRSNKIPMSCTFGSTHRLLGVQSSTYTEFVAVTLSAG